MIVLFHNVDYFTRYWSCSDTFIVYSHDCRHIAVSLKEFWKLVYIWRQTRESDTFLAHSCLVFCICLILCSWTSSAKSPDHFWNMKENTCNAGFIHCRYSSLSEADKAAAFTLWQKKWDQFIEQTVEMYSCQWCRQGGFNECENSP